MRALAARRNDLQSMQKEAAAGKRAPRSRRIEPVIENFKRTKKGFKLMSQEMERLLQKQCELFPAKCMTNVDFTEVRFTYKGEAKKIGTGALLKKTPYFFSAFYSSIRNKLLFGQKVMSWYQTAPLI